MPSSAARPLVDARVAGVLGDRDEMLARKLARSLPRGAHRVVSTAAVEFHSAIPVISTGDGRICWNPLARSGDSATWQAASQNWLAAGLDMSGERPVLHSCGWGLQELYFREIGSAVYFCDRIDPLVELDGAQLHPDWDAWAS